MNRKRGGNCPKCGLVYNPELSHTISEGKISHPCPRCYSGIKGKIPNCPACSD